MEYHIKPPPHQPDIVKLPPIQDQNKLVKNDKETIKDEIKAQDKVNLKPPIDLDKVENADSALNNAPSVMKETNEKIHDKLEEKISELEKKVDELKEDILEQQGEMEKVKDQKAANNDKTPVEVKGHKEVNDNISAEVKDQEEAKVEKKLSKEPVDERTPHKIEPKSGVGIADKHSVDPVIVKNPPEIDNFDVEEVKQGFDNVGVADPAKPIDTALDSDNVELKDIKNVEFEGMESSKQAHLAGGRDLKSVNSTV